MNHNAPEEVRFPRDPPNALMQDAPVDEEVQFIQELLPAVIPPPTPNVSPIPQRNAAQAKNIIPNAQAAPIPTVNVQAAQIPAGNVQAQQAPAQNVHVHAQQPPDSKFHRPGRSTNYVYYV